MRDHLYATFFILLALILLLYSTWCGIGLTYDSHDYLAASTSFALQGKLINATGTAFIMHAPFFPVFIAMLGSNPIIKLKLLNLLFFCLTLIILYLTNYRFFKNRWFAHLGIFIIGFSVGHQMIYNFLWSEPLFLFFFALHNFFLIRFLNEKKKYDFWLMILFAFMMCVTRNAGFFIIIPTTWILFTIISRSWRDPLLYFFISALGFGMWNIYVLVAHNGMEAIYYSNEFFNSMWINSTNYLDVMSRWIFPVFVPLFFRLICLIICAVILGYVLYLKKIPKAAMPYFIQFGVYVMIMSIFLKVYMDDIERYLAMVYPGFIIGLLLVLDQLSVKFNYKLKKILFFCIVLWVSYLGIRSVHNVNMWHNSRCAVKITRAVD